MTKPINNNDRPNDVLEQALRDTLKDHLIEYATKPDNCTIESIKGVDTSDYPDFVDTFATEVYNNKLERYLDEYELDYYNDNNTLSINQYVLDNLYSE